MSPPLGAVKWTVVPVAIVRIRVEHLCSPPVDSARIAMRGKRDMSDAVRSTQLVLRSWQLGATWYRYHSLVLPMHTTPLTLHVCGRSCAFLLTRPRD